MSTTAYKRINSPFQPVGRWIRVEKRLAIYLRDRFTCLYCLRDLHAAAPTDITLEHATPRSDGGSNHQSNLFTACRACNCSRQDTPLARFAGPETRAHIKRNMARDLRPCLKLAKAIMAGELDRAAGLRSAKQI